MNNKELLAKYRQVFSVALALTIVVAGVIEIIAYFIFVITGRCELSFTDAYLLRRVMFPIALNTIIYLIVVLIKRDLKEDSSFKNDIIVHGASAIACVISVVHREFVVNTGAFMFPIILCAMFASKKLIMKTFIFSLLSILVTAGFSYFDESMDITKAINYLVMYGFLIVSFFACYIFIKFSQYNSEIIESQAQTNDKLKSIILLDQMTGLYNHRTFYSELDLVIDRYLDEEKPFCLAMLDIDRFKHINDVYRHDSGDRVIQNLADIMKNNCKGGKAFRYGGEEFALIFADESLDASREIVEKIKDLFSDTKYDFTDERITFSAGISKYDGSHNREEFFSLVDKLLYTAKENGRNQIRTECLQPA